MRKEGGRVCWWRCGCCVGCDASRVERNVLVCEKERLVRPKNLAIDE